MINKQFFRDSLLPLSVLLALMRLQWDPISQQHGVEIQGIQDIILGESFALTETQFHNWHSLYEDEYVHIHPKQVDNGIYSRSIFNELHSLNDRNRLLSLIPAGLEITTLLLDNDETHARRNLNIPSHSEVPSNSASNDENDNANGISAMHSEDLNNNNLEVDGAIASPDSGVFDFQDISPEDMDLIEALWRQDIDMGITREDTFPFKSEIELEKTKAIEEKTPQGNWQYNIDCETGEQLPVAPQPTNPTLSAPTQMSTLQDSSLSFEDCLNLLDDFNPQVENPTPRVVPPLVDADEIEQRWQDLASISELQIDSMLSGGNSNSVESTESRFPNTTWNNSMPSDEQNVFAFNATTNGNVNLQNATSPQLSLFNSTTQQMTNDRLLTVDIQDTQLFSAVNETQMNNTSPDLFSPISSFNNMSISGVPPSPLSSQGSSVNLTTLMAEQQRMQQENGTASPAPSAPSQSGSLLLELLNSTESNIDDDTEMQEMNNMIDMLASINEEDGTPMELFSEDESVSANESEDSIEGASGFNRDAFKQEFTNGFKRGGASPCHSDVSSTSSLDSSHNAESIHHNHSYASSSDTGSQKGFRSSNNSRNSTSGEDSNRISRDQKRAKELNIPIPVEKIINLPVDNFNDLLKKYDFNNEQIQLIRDIRRRGKNKVAAQNCRKRKITAIQQVEGSVGAMQNEHDKLLKERDKVSEELSNMQERFDELYHQVFQNMRDRNGDQVDPNRYRLEIMEDGSVILVPRNGTNTADKQPTDKKYSSS